VCPGVRPCRRRGKIHERRRGGGGWDILRLGLGTLIFIAGTQGIGGKLTRCYRLRRGREKLGFKVWVREFYLGYAWGRARSRLWGVKRDIVGRKGGRQRMGYKQQGTESHLSKS